jgi:hypothetical protein
MKRNFFFPIILFAATIISCNSSSSKENTKPAEGANLPVPVPATQVNTTPSTTTPAAATPAQQTVVTPTANTIQPPATNVQPVPVTTKTAAGLNPKHGMPGHRCDIPEGAPLNSQPSSNIVAPQPVQQSPVNITKSQSAAIPQPTPVTAAPVATGAGLNPEHGKPGHRCDIAVGVPLNSAPAPAPTPVPVPAKQ